jgi:hypothetical protein
MVRKFKLNRRIVESGPPNDEERRYEKKRAATRADKPQQSGSKHAAFGGH